MDTRKENMYTKFHQEGFVNAYKKWTQVLKNNLIENMKFGYDDKKMSNIFKRTPTSIYCQRRNIVYKEHFIEGVAKEDLIEKYKLTEEFWSKLELFHETKEIREERERAAKAARKEKKEQEKEIKRMKKEKVDELLRTKKSDLTLVLVEILETVKEIHSMFKKFTEDFEVES